MNLNCCKNKSAKKLKQVAEFINVISEKNRLQILWLIKKEEKCVCEIWQQLKLPQNLVSHHLRVLKDFGLIFLREEGVRNFYRLNQKVVKKYLRLLNKFLNSKEE